MAIIRFDPFSDVAHFFEHVKKGRVQTNFATDIYEQENNLIVEMQIPGAKPESITIDLENQNLRVSGKEEKEAEIKKRNYYLKEITTGSFERFLHLPMQVEADNVTAQVKDGILTIVLPKKQKSHAKKNIKVEKAKHH